MSSDYAIAFSKDSTDDLRSIGRYIEQVSGSRWVQAASCRKFEMPCMDVLPHQ